MSSDRMQKRVALTALPTHIFNNFIVLLHQSGADLGISWGGAQDTNCKINVNNEWWMININYS